MSEGLPDDEVLLAAAGWADYPTARILAKDGDDDFCVAVVDPNGALGGTPYDALEFIVHDSAGRWIGDGDVGPAAGTGWHHGQVYVCGRSSSATVTIEHAGRHHIRPTGIDGWWIFVTPQEDLEPKPRRVGPGLLTERIRDHLPWKRRKAGR